MIIIIKKEIQKVVVVVYGFANNTEEKKSNWIGEDTSLFYWIFKMLKIIPLEDFVTGRHLFFVVVVVVFFFFPNITSTISCNEIYSCYSSGRTEGKSEEEEEKNERRLIYDFADILRRYFQFICVLLSERISYNFCNSQINEAAKNFSVFFEML